MSEKGNSRTGRHPRKRACADRRGADASENAQVETVGATQRAHFDKLAELHRAIARELQILLEVSERERTLPQHHRDGWVRAVSQYSKIANFFDALPIDHPADDAEGTMARLGPAPEDAGFGPRKMKH